jgi:hypothetical protein
VGADDRRVEDQDAEVGVAEDGRQRGEAAGLGPAVEPPPLAVPVPQPLGQVAPGDAGAGDIKDGVEEAAVILGESTGCDLRTM